MALQTIVPKVLSVFRDRFPQIELDILEACTENQVEALRLGKIDVGFLHPPLRTPFLTILPIYREPLMFALPSGHRLSLQEAIARSELANETLILHQRQDGSVLYDYIIHCCKRAGFTPKIIHRSTGQTFISLVTAQLGISLLAPSMQQVKNPGVVFVAIADDAPTLEYALAWRGDDTSPIVEEFRQVIQEVIGNSSMLIRH